MSAPYPHPSLVSLKLAAALVASALLAGCASMAPQPLSESELTRVSGADLRRAQRDVEPLVGPLRLEEAIARAIKYNLERRARTMEQSVAAGQLEVGNYDMLPKLVASAGYRNRDNDVISRSTDSVTGAPSLSHPYISSDRIASTTDLSFTWSLLDFGQSYYAAKQNADRVLIAAERRRKALHLLIQDVRTAFWRVTSAQKLRAEISAAIRDSEAVLADSRKAEAERLRNPIDALRYQRQLLENLRLLESIEQELSTARVELASLANLPLATEMSVQEPSGALATAWLEIPVEQLEQRAILRNADLRESFYNARIAGQETRRAMLKLFPGLSFNYAARGSDDSYLINQHWNEAGAQISFNLLGMLAAPAQLRLADAGVALADQRRVATQMAVLTQVHIARQQYANALRQFTRADAIWQVDVGIAAHVAKREQAETQTRLDRVANQTAAILSQLRRFQALAQVEAAAGRLQASLGMEPDIKGASNMSLAALSAAVAVALKQWDAGQFEVLTTPAAPTAPAAPAAAGK